MSWFQRFLEKHPRLNRWYSRYVAFDSKCERLAQRLWAPWNTIVVCLITIGIISYNIYVVSRYDNYPVVMPALSVLGVMLVLKLLTIYRRVKDVKSWRAKLKAAIVAILVGDASKSWQRSLRDFNVIHGAIKRWIAGISLTAIMVLFAIDVMLVVLQLTSINAALREMFELPALYGVAIFVYFLFEESLTLEIETPLGNAQASVTHDTFAASGTAAGQLLSVQSNDQGTLIHGQSSSGLDADVTVSDRTIEVETSEASAKDEKVNELESGNTESMTIKR